MQAVLGGNSGGVLMEVLTWVPIWTPFGVLARLGLGIPTWEVIGTGILLAAFTAAEIVLLGRLFRASLLAQGQRPNLSEPGLEDRPQQPVVIRQVLIEEVTAAGSQVARN